MKPQRLLLVAHLATLLVEGMVKYERANAPFSKAHIQRCISGGQLFLSNTHITKQMRRKKNIQVHTQTANVEISNQEDMSSLNKKDKISFTKTKQIATIGPATENFEQLEKLYLSGIDVFRLNFSHGLKSIKKYIINSLRIIEKKYNTSIGILGDIQGPKIRIGEFEKSEKNAMEKNTFVELKEGDIFSFDLIDMPGNEKRVQLNYPELLKNVKSGQMILLDDGNLKMKVIENQFEESNMQNNSLKVKVITGGKLYSKKGFCIPNMIMPIEVLNEKDIKDILFCINEGVDFLGYSFVQTKYDLIFLKTIIKDYYESDFFQNKVKKDRLIYDEKKLQMKEYDDPNDFYIKEVEDYYQHYYLKNYEKYKKIYDVYKNQDLQVDADKAENQLESDGAYQNSFDNGNTEITDIKADIKTDIKTEIKTDIGNPPPSDNTKNIFIVSKIEKPSAVKNIESIINLSDAIMIARGDLGIETNLSNLPILQKKIINLCRIKYNKPVIVATQMMESMRFLPSPTRAEVADVATALYDGSDCVMLSAETATGQYPILTTSTQNSVIRDVENDYYYYEYTQRKNNNLVKCAHDMSASPSCKGNSHFEKLIYSIRDLSNNINLKSIILFSNEFEKIQKLSNLRTKAPIIVITENVALARKLQLTWGVYPYISNLTDSNKNDLLTLINYGCKVSREEGFVKAPEEYSLVTFTKNINNSSNLLYLCQPCLTT
ncbi:pyruvate kinase 2, putative [Plasmodium knowlesi strain H]|uniref:pyruvate kinase n=3 Tax=Plasmodium knowlesi TaxID=5850 RepID=A0A5K1VU44_PLAKH|nr:pyruvate kinase. pyruvate kinase [Plasmodium knowlesi strain H]OTN68313.1 putative Pyruvate kinase 2 [Plasmodium knowlesi]CAA9987266.1 pyruvate kinase 2, putative [Plasmodium knowlesi strain H]SBO24041.1 pyruvate kinase 2, putative [Plasmodium knowlesi strain H]SBO26070.1 pyruvate kinase 2, putative [Plasmodium knowlesi strain H]VVS76740.1 pyruvate kinase 2, putative [Plasmodium knowlesi strain H]|eukprot:XP_002261887.1 pyruvate kinase. pyruvate kinase [Plasmodium knowlesi strain H]